MKFKPFWCLVDARTGCFYLVQFDSILKSFMAIFLFVIYFHVGKLSLVAF